jgi:hypothetical protein
MLSDNIVLSDNILILADNMESDNIMLSADNMLSENIL